MMLARFLFVFSLLFIFGFEINDAKDASIQTIQVPVNKEIKAQYKELNTQISDKQDWYKKIEGQVYHQQALILSTDKDPLDVALRRCEVLIADLSKKERLEEGMVEEFRKISQQIENVEVQQKNKRKRLFEELLTLRRKISFSNPLLNFDKLVFTASHSSAGDFHMCDQYYGIFARPGGSVYVLKNPFSENPELKDLIADAKVQNGRLKGRTLNGGMFLLPALSYDGKKVLFSYSECGRDTDNPTPLEVKSDNWSKESSFHVFCINADGSNLVQLTDGAWNDVHPYWMPDGRILFISERRGGFLRCSGERPCPNFTMHAMDADGKNIVRISHHETNEWHPSINNNGKILYTRWDYIDRGDDQAHHPWIASPDGRNPRAIHGNYKYRHQDGADMEVYVRPIPGSHKYVALAAPHHGGSYGSLIVIDPHVEDDDAMSPVKRLTPDDGFPETRLTDPEEYERNGKRGTGLYTFDGEAESSRKLYSAATALSEHYYLTTRDKKLYLIDAFGNRELIWEMPDMYALGPVPLMSRERPPVIPSQSQPARLVENPDYMKVGDEHPIDKNDESYKTPGTVSVMNVYNSKYPFPEGTKIKALRIVQMLQKTTPVHQAPAIGYGMETGARAVLGTVPVEEDGSVFFELPPAKLVYFQALDENGEAVQSMKSGTYVQGGENLSCIGCHEEKGQSPQNMNRLALQRPPSQIQPEASGSNPLSFPLLVQPVLDNNCVKCHDGKEKAFDLSAGNWREDEYNWYTSYRNLHKYVWHSGALGKGYDLWNVPRSIPGKVGAKASELIQMLKNGHHDVELSKEEMRRLVVWIDTNSDFFGSYENIVEQAAGEVVWPAME